MLIISELSGTLSGEITKAQTGKRACVQIALTVLGLSAIFRVRQFLIVFLLA